MWQNIHNITCICLICTRALLAHPHMYAYAEDFFKTFLENFGYTKKSTCLFQCTASRGTATWILSLQHLAADYMLSLSLCACPFQLPLKCMLRCFFSHNMWNFIWFHCRLACCLSASVASCFHQPNVNCTYSYMHVKCKYHSSNTRKKNVYGNFVVCLLNEWTQNSLEAFVCKCFEAGSEMCEHRH